MSQSKCLPIIEYKPKNPGIMNESIVWDVAWDMPKNAWSGEFVMRNNLRCKLNGKFENEHGVTRAKNEPDETPRVAKSRPGAEVQSN